ncbi:MAG: Enoyl-[acyl-carrier protein] reductase [Pseudonocardia sp.]|jgi:NAD(P)H-dependent flavin oxidoreductase YrpB (nitropropane dioxygenase family)|uniref:NAD(P)H-dependent flavin oxidoreductase n=1 Tax=Pseudonocardia sp. TaxID=60912 RepID=UPI002612D2B5|nr:nitronate monooxygenase [Pseudonocardia sp.]MCU1627908.1 Enoyl-[acyl-carrier protein] reductase [Pseudonocardia sp.]
MLTTGLCRQLGVSFPIWNAGMGGGLAGAELAAAVSNAGGLGVLGMGGLPAPVIREQIRETRALTNKPFGVNIIMPLMGQDDTQVECCLEEKVPVLIFFWGDAGPYIEKAHAVGTKVVVQVGSVAEAKAAAAAGVDAVMIQGVEAGGHVRGTTGLSISLPATVDAVQPLPVIAAGGIADARGVAAALALGAQAVSLGTRFLCSDESRAAYKDRVVQATAEDTYYTKLFDLEWSDAPHRVLRNKAVEEWEAAGSPASGQRPGEGQVAGQMPVGGQVIELPRYSVFMPMEGFEGDLDYAVLYCGQSCSLIDDVKPAAEIVRTLVEGAEAISKSAFA